MKKTKSTSFSEPFPHVIVENFYDPSELELIWEELKFYTRPGKLLEAEEFGGIPDATNSHALLLDEVYEDLRRDGGPNYRNLSNILTLNRKLFTGKYLDQLSDIHDSCLLAPRCDRDTTKVRYYHDGEYYEPHTDSPMNFIAFYYTHKEPKKFTGGDLVFPRYNCEVTCDNNSMIIMPGWVQHGVTRVNIENSDYYDGYGRYCISSFMYFAPT